MSSNAILLVVVVIALMAAAAFVVLYVYRHRIRTTLVSMTSRRAVSNTRIRREDVPFAERLNRIRIARDPRFVVAGGIYLDIRVEPVRTTQLDGAEHSDLDRLDLRCGGSAQYVGRHLYEQYSIKSELFTRLGGDDPLSSHLHRLLSKQEWIKPPSGGKQIQFQHSSARQSGVSIQLFHGPDLKYTTFTHKGALIDLEWEEIVQHLNGKVDQPGVLHISGYFRTGLYANLSEALKQLPPWLIVCVDHGRFVPRDSSNPTDALKGAFKARLIDVYICTIDEFRNFFGLQANGIPTTDELENYARRFDLPPVTIIRTNPVGERVSAYVLMDGVAKEKHAVMLHTALQHVPGRSNTFNANFIYLLTQGRSQPAGECGDCRQQVEEAVSVALMKWANPTETHDA